MNAKRARKRYGAVRAILILLVVCVNVFPIYWMLITSLRPDTQILRKPPKLQLDHGQL